MRFFRFVGWWWKNHDIFDRSVLVALFWGAPCAISSIWIGELAIEIALTGFAIVLGFIFLYVFLVAMGKQWEKFNQEDPPEDQKIVNRLRGIDSTDW